MCFCYLGDTLDGDGGADPAATYRIRNGWMKFRELLLSGDTLDGDDGSDLAATARIRNGWMKFRELLLSGRHS